MMNKVEYFASPIYDELKPEWLDKLNKLSDPYITDARKKAEPNNKAMRAIGYKSDMVMSYHSGPLEPDEDFRFYHDYIAKKSRWCLDDMGYDMTNYNLIFTESWVQEFSFNGGGHHWFHTHPNCHISGFYFLKCTEFTSKPLFQDPRIAHVPLKLKEKNPEIITNSNDLINWKVQPGTLLLFPAYMSHAYSVDHGVDPHRFMHINMRAIEKDVFESFSSNSM